MVTLTRRQQEFLGALVDLHRQEGESVHYSLVADHMGVGNVATYEMLRYLEDLNLVQRQFKLSMEDRGPGRPQVGFVPTPAAVKHVSQVWGKGWIGEEWAKVKTQILDKLSSAKVVEYDEILGELIDRLPQQPSPTAYMAEMITTLILGLHSLKGHAEARRLRNILKKIELPGELGLSAIPGISVALSLVERINRQLSDVLLNQANKFQATLAELSVERRRILAEFTREVAEIVEG
jgi:hypothetical protein